MKKSKMNKKQKLQQLNKKMALHAVFLTGISATLISIACLFILYSFDEAHQNNIVWRIFNSIAMGALPLGLISIIFSYFDRMSYVREHVASAIFDVQGYLYFDEDKQRQIKNEIERNLCLKNDDPDNLYSSVQCGLDEIIQDVYVNELIIHIDCKKITDMFEKKVDETFEYMLPQIKNRNKLQANLSDLIPKYLFQSPKQKICEMPQSADKCELCDKSCIRDYKVEVNNEEVEMELVENKLDYKDLIDYEYQYGYECVDKKKNKIVFTDKPVKIHMSFLSKVPVTDPLYVYKCKKATRNLTIHFDYDNEELEVFPIGFGFMDRTMVDDSMTISRFPHSTKIRFKNWLLPGNGVVFVILPKQENIKIDKNV